ncbi:hypothetical protein BCEP4_1540011 [Burkholderia cepacia]|nr:hypothetical protein BCEP4_1540011 [Burkholderia cepacia]
MTFGVPARSKALSFQTSYRTACASDARRQRRLQHFGLERGNPLRVFHGAAFVPAD